MGESPAVAKAILLEDDAIASEVLSRQLQRLGFVVFAYDRLDTLQQNLARCLPAKVALIDLSLPDGDGGSALPWLRSHCAKLVATSADWTNVSRQSRLAAGFDVCLEKPCNQAELCAALAIDSATAGNMPTSPKPNPATSILPVFDDALALSALGSMTAVQAMRGLFRDELLSLVSQLQAAATAQTWIEQRPVLHRLAASSGFVGAKALQAAVVELQTSLSDEAGRRLLMAVQACLAALAAGPSHSEQ